MRKMGRGGRGEEEEEDSYGARVWTFLNIVSSFLYISVQSCIMYYLKKKIV